MLTPRTQAIKDAIFDVPRIVDLERALLYTESWRTTEGQPVVVRRARAIANVLAKHRSSSMTMTCSWETAAPRRARASSRPR